MDWIDVGSSPTEESCAQVGSEGYYEQARHECRAYLNQLRHLFGPEPDGARLAVKSHPHDFGTYLSVACYYDPAKPPSVEYAFGCENRSPEHWDEEALQELADRKAAS